MFPFQNPASYERAAATRSGPEPSGLPNNRDSSLSILSMDVHARPQTAMPHPQDPSFQYLPTRLTIVRQFSVHSSLNSLSPPEMDHPQEVIYDIII